MVMAVAAEAHLLAQPEAAPVGAAEMVAPKAAVV